ncbi:hypothetical protein [Aciditerrimonas ferrireducens]|uniref:hypothetical protein n=1 Tax=Aciditerrimonas ferrireducens TaxID=667306 RepID=UPI002006CC81|nr:hypothetical protein [Aciditerrimonas ferrireducens]MCK4177098.1 hypothetical protein [Aciditerrimonas ferrireducens]
MSEATAPTGGHEGLTGPVGVAVQTVRYGQDPRWLAERWAPALAQALEVATAEGRLREAVVRVGDCSPEPLSLVAQGALAAAQLPQPMPGARKAPDRPGRGPRPPRVPAGCALGPADR